MDIFEKLKKGDSVDMFSKEYIPAIEELNRANKMLFHVNHTEPGTKENEEAMEAFFDGTRPEGLSIFTPFQIDFPKQMQFGKRVFINHSFTAMSIGGITIGDNVQIGPNVTVVTDNHDLKNRYALKCKPVNICNNVWIGANVTILPGVTIGENAVVAGGAVVTKNVPSNTVVGGNPAKVLKQLESDKEAVDASSVKEQLQKQIEDMYRFTTRVFEFMKSNHKDEKLVELLGKATDRDERFLAEHLIHLRSSMDQDYFLIEFLNRPVTLEGKLNKKADGTYELCGYEIGDKFPVEFVDEEDNWQFGVLEKKDKAYVLIDRNRETVNIELNGLWVRTREKIN